jgi:DegV family protein with EDD domain
MSEYDDIHILDTRQATLSQRLLVEHAVQLRRENKSAEEIVDAVMDVSKRIRLYAVVDTLTYLVRGGRLSKTAGFMGTMLSIKPIISLQDGSILAAGKAKGREAANKKLLSYVNEDSNFDPAFPIHFGYTGNREPLDNFIKSASESLNLKSTVTYPVGGVIGTHTGPNAIAVAWVVK